MQTLPSRSSLHPQPVQHPPKLIALGDSLVYGYGDWEGGGWVERLRRRWMQPPHLGPILYNLGIRGDGIVQVLQRFEVEFRHRGELRNRTPEGILLSVGINDSARLGKPQGRNHTEFPQFCEAVACLLDRSQQLCPTWVLGMVPVDETKMPFLDCFYFNHADQRRYNGALRQACQVRDIPFLDLFEQWSGPELGSWLPCLLEDGLHPNQEGHSRILDQVLPWLMETPTWSQLGEDRNALARI